ncbi:MAG: hypothetical protein IT322_01965 [Anaerolineae bacterium]|nr:hypothetical protein [Anaerolineae bacterium]CAG1013015.1 hypothetical protein ANRL4_04809 [Anaerolineae bacterium]
MSILPGLTSLHWRDESADELTGMIGDLIEQANTNYLQYLAAAATQKKEQAWSRYHESIDLERDIDTLTLLYEIAGNTAARRLQKH